MEVKYCRAQHEVLGSFIRYRLQTWGPWNQLPLSYWSDCTVKRPNHPSPSQLTRELQRLLTRARLLSEVCCKPISPLAAAIRHASISQEFTDILMELQWSLNVVSNARICKYTTDKSSSKLKEFPWEARIGEYEQELLEIAEQQDWRELMEQLERLDRDHECSGGECGNMHGRSDRRFCLAVQLIEEWRSRQGSSGDDSNHLSTLFSFDEEVLTHGRPLGSGAFGAVTKCTWLGVDYAQKFFGFDSGGLTFLRAEAEALAKLNHPHIVKVHAWSRNSLLLDLMSIDLHKFIKARLKGGTRDEPFSLRAAVDLMLQISEAVRYLHTQGMAHRDLKSANILVDPVSTSSEDLEDGFVFAKVADFGLAKTKHEVTSYSHLTHNMGTRRYMAPEIFGANKDDVHLEHAYPMKADVYSFGVICSEILTGEEPYIDVGMSSLYSKLTGEIPLRPRLPWTCPTSLSSLICACWHADPRERPAFADVCKVLRYINGVQTLPENPSWNPIDETWPYGRISTFMGVYRESIYRTSTTHMEREGTTAGFGGSASSFTSPWDIMGVNAQFMDTSMERVNGISVAYLSGGQMSTKYVCFGIFQQLVPNNDWIMFDYPSEYLVQVEVHTTGEYHFVRAISFITTKKKYGPYGKIGEGVNFTRLIPASPKRIVGFSSTSGIGYDIYFVEDVVRCLQHFLS